MTFDGWREDDKDLVQAAPSTPPAHARELYAPRAEVLAAEQRRAMAAARLRVMILLGALAALAVGIVWWGRG